MAHASADPLVVLDGMPGVPMDLIDPEDIAEFIILKDGETARYGLRGGPGVIEIKTKQGALGKPSFRWHTQLALQSPVSRLQPLDATEYRALLSRRFGATPHSPHSTRWLDEIADNSVSYASNFSSFGGNRAIRYRAFINYRDVNGIQRDSGFEQINLGLHLSGLLMNDRLDYQLMTSHTDRSANPGFPEAFGYAMSMYPDTPVYDEQSPYGGYYQTGRFEMYNPVALLQQTIKERESEASRVALSLGYDIFDGHTLKFNGGYASHSFFEGQFAPAEAYYLGASAQGYASINASSQQSLYYDMSWSGTRQFGRLEVDATAGFFEQYVDHEYQNHFARQVEGGYQNLAASPYFDQINHVFADGFGFNSYKLRAYYGTARFSFDKAYDIQLAYRREGSNLLGREGQWGNFPYLRAGIDLATLTRSGFFDQLMAKVSYGVSGNLPTRGGLSQERWSPVGLTYYDGRYIRSYDITQHDNPNLTFERSKKMNYAIAFALLDNQLQGAINVFTHVHQDMIILKTPRVDVVPYGYRYRYYGNGPGIKSRGVEIDLTYRWKTKGRLSMQTRMMYAGLSMAYTQLTGSDYDLENTDIGQRGAPGGCGCEGLNRLNEGEPPGRIMGREVLGISEGRWSYQNDDGSGWVPSADHSELGLGFPSATLGLSHDMSWGGWTVSMLWEGVFGHSIVNLNRMNLQAPGGAREYNVLDSYPELNDLEWYGEFNSFFVEKADFFGSM